MTSAPTPISSEMVETVARALADALLSPGYWHMADDKSRGTYRALAQSAIKAMRIPTPRMLEDVGAMEGYEYDNTKSDEHHIDWWQAMIDAALSETPT